MKKFLIFLVVIVVAVSFGLTIFYFVRNDEIISFTTKDIYCNVGDVIKLDQLGLKVKKRNKKTTYDYNAGGEEVTNKVEWDNKYGQYQVKSDVEGGDVTLVIKTSNKNYSKFTILLHIGDGSKANPFNVFDENDLSLIGTAYGNDKYFVLRQDVVLTENYAPVTLFSGDFNGNNHTVSGINLTNKSTDAGLFARLENASVYDLGLENVKINGEFDYAGALAGEVLNSSISCVYVNNAEITSTSASGVVGGLAGKITTSNNVISSYAENTTLTGNNIVGGLVGVLDRSMLSATYAVANLKTSGEGSSAVLGGLVGEFIIGSEDGSIQQSYAYASSTSANLGTLIGKISQAVSGSVKNEKVYLVGNYAVGEDANRIKNNTTDLFKTLYEQDKDYKIVSISKTAVENKNLSDVNFVYYQTTTGKTLWKDTNAWFVTTENLPALRMVKDFKGLSSDFVNSPVSGVVGGEADDTDTTRKALEQYLKDPKESFSLKQDFTYDMTGVTITDPKDIKDIVIDGQNAEIKNLTVNGCLFNNVDNCTIKNVKFTNLTITGAAKGLLGKVYTTDKYTTSLISNVTVNYKEDQNSYIKTVDEEFGGLAAIVDNKTSIENVKVENLVVDANSTNAYVAGLVGDLHSGTLTNSSIANVKLAGAQAIAGAVAQNYGTITNFQVVGNAEILANNALFIGGIASINCGIIENSTSSVYIQVSASTLNGAHIGGLVADNDYASSKIANCEFTGRGIVLLEIGEKDQLRVGGVACYNSGVIENVKVTAEKIDVLNISDVANALGKTFFVGGVVYSNDYRISKVVVNSNLAGNVVAGVAVEAVGKIDQVYVGKTGERNSIVGDKYVAGVAVVEGSRITTKYNGNELALEFGSEVSATISNVQTYSALEGKTNDTISSLVLLVFPDCAVFKNGVINNTATGFGKLYTETWTDYAGPNYYNVYGEDGSAGTFTSVVINNTHIAETLRVKSSYFHWTLNSFQFNTGYKHTGNTNFFRYANDDDFAKSSTFTGNVTIVANGDNSQGWKFWWNDYFTYNWTFGSEWTVGDGIQLAFLNPVQE